MPTDVPAQSGWCRCVEDCYTIVKQIGEGTYGQVYLAKETQTQAMVALKKIRMDTEKEGFPITAMREMRLLTRLQHQNVLSLKEVVRSRREVTASTPHNLLAGGETLKLSLYLLCMVQLTVGMIQVIRWITCLCTCPFQSAELDRILACTVWAPVVMLNTHLHAAKKSNQERGSIYMVFEYMDHDLTGLMERRNYKFQASHVCAMPLHAPARAGQAVSRSDCAPAQPKQPVERFDNMPASTAYLGDIAVANLQTSSSTGSARPSMHAGTPAQRPRSFTPCRPSAT